MSLTHLPDSQIRNLTVLENLILNNDLVFNNKLVVNDATDGNNSTGSIKTAGSISSAKNVYANSFSLPGVSLTSDGSTLANSANSIIAGNSLTNGNQNGNGYKTLGDNIAFKVKRLTGTFTSSANNSVNIAHGLDWTKILSSNVLVKTTTGGIQPSIPPNFTITANLEFQYQITSSNVVVFSNSNSSNLFNCPITVTILYSN